MSAVQALAQSLAANSSGQAAQLSTLQNNVSTLKLQTETDVYTLQTEVLWLRQQLCSYNGLNFSTPVLQRLPTQGAIRWTSFRLGNTEHLAVANLRNDTSFNIQSVIYAFNLSSVSFVPWQYLNTSGASEMMHFRAGSPEEDFLLVTNAFNGTTENIFSDIYRYDRTVAQFVLFQQIDTSAARHAHAFVHANTTYLVVANYFNGTTHNILSNVYRYDNVGQQFVLHQQVPTSGASSVESVHINGVRYIAIANFNNDTSHTVPSNIYRFDNTTNQLVLHQQIITNGAFDWRAFSFNGTDFLAVANSFDGENHTIPSVVYRFDLATSLFLPFQNISTVAARSWEYFVVGSTSFLAVAEGRHVMNDTIKVTENSSIYYFDQTQQQFVHFRDIPTLGAVQWHHFTLGPSAFLALAEIRDDTSFSVSSPLYHLNRLCWNHLTPWREWAQESRALGINLEASFF